MQRKLYLVILFLLIGSFFGASCQTANQPEMQTEAPPVADPIVLELQGLEETRSLTLSELKSLEDAAGWGGTISSAGVISPPQQLKGVSLLALAELVGGLEPGMGLSIVAKDGYGMTMSYEQILNGDFITYDPGTGSENQVEGHLQAIVAYERDGELLGDDGPLRLFVISPKNDNIVDGHWTVKWVTQIRLKPMSEEWSLHLEGARTEDMDRNSFESCSAPGCHQSSWTDGDGNEWRGVPLYYLAGRVDGGNIHEDRAYNDIFAKEGYTIELFAADGYNVSIESERTIFNRDIFLAGVLNGEPLGEDHFPLRLVGEGLETSEMVGQVAQIVIYPHDGVAMPTDGNETDTTEEIAAPVLPEGAVLLLHGKVLNQLALKLENLTAMNSVEIETEHPKDGLQTYDGIRLNDLLNLAGPNAGTTTLVVTASDGYAAELSLAEVQNCADCLLTLTSDGAINTVMAGMQSNFWVKNVSFIEVK